MGHHGSGSGLAVGTGDADSILVSLHDHAPGLSPLKHRNTLVPALSDFRIIVMGSCGTDHTHSAMYIFCPMADGNLNALGDQFIGTALGTHLSRGRQEDFQADSSKEQLR